jgi:NifB/MoaA-like Fe-S oxidoreductase
MYTPKKILKQFQCKDCTDRHVGCHAECEKYKAVKEQQNEAYKIMAQQYGKDRMLEDYTVLEKVKNKKYSYYDIKRNARRKEKSNGKT